MSWKNCALVTFLISVTIYLTKGKLKKKAYLELQFKDIVHHDGEGMMVGTWYIVSSVRNCKEIDPGAPFALPYLFSLGLQPMGWYHLHLEWVFLSCTFLEAPS